VGNSWRRWAAAEVEVGKSILGLLSFDLGFGRDGGNFLHFLPVELLTFEACGSESLDARPRERMVDEFARKKPQQLEVRIHLFGEVQLTLRVIGGGSNALCQRIF